MRFTLKGLLLTGLLWSATVPVQAAGNIQGMRFGDWGGNCEGQMCYIQQVLSQGEQPLMVTAIGYAPGKPYPTIIFELPKGAPLQNGLEFQVGNQPAIKFKGSCDKDACHAGFVLDEPMLYLFRKGREATLSVKLNSKDKQPTKLPLSLMGFSKGVSMLR